jgi:hypothetical protein
MGPSRLIAHDGNLMNGTTLKVLILFLRELKGDIIFRRAHLSRLKRRLSPSLQAHLSSVINKIHALLKYHGFRNYTDYTHKKCVRILTTRRRNYVWIHRQSHSLFSLSTIRMKWMDAVVRSHSAPVLSARRTRAGFTLTESLCVRAYSAAEASPEMLLLPGHAVVHSYIYCSNFTRHFQAIFYGSRDISFIFLTVHDNSVMAYIQQFKLL